MTVVPGAITAALACALGLTDAVPCPAHTVPPRARARGLRVLGFTTPVWTVAADAVWPHTVTVLGIGGMAWAPPRTLVAGRVSSAASPCGAVCTPPSSSPCSACCWAGGAGRRDHARRSAPSAPLFLGLVCVWTRWMYGSWNPIASYGSGVFDDANQARSTHQHLAMLDLTRPRHPGLDAVAPAAPALVRGWRDVPDWARALLSAGWPTRSSRPGSPTAWAATASTATATGIELVVAATPALAMSVAPDWAGAPRSCSARCSPSSSARWRSGAIVTSSCSRSRPGRQRVLLRAAASRGPSARSCCCASYCFAVPVVRIGAARHPDGRRRVEPRRRRSARAGSQRWDRELPLRPVGPGSSSALPPRSPIRPRIERRPRGGPRPRPPRDGPPGCPDPRRAPNHHPVGHGLQQHPGRALRPTWSSTLSRQAETAATISSTRAAGSSTAAGSETVTRAVLLERASSTARSTRPSRRRSRGSTESWARISARSRAPALPPAGRARRPRRRARLRVAARGPAPAARRRARPAPSWPARPRSRGALGRGGRSPSAAGSRTRSRRSGRRS